MRNSIYQLISSIKAYDDLENQHKQFALAWIESGADLFRITKPDVPQIHLVSYFAVFNDAKSKILLGHHKAADLWLPSGGHVEANEHPADTVKRECLEELDIAAKFAFAAPVFLTVTDVNCNNSTHTDVSLWYALHSDENLAINFCKTEYYAMQFFEFKSIPYPKTDPHMQRFLTKLNTVVTNTPATSLII
jgi:8-oxo-dGTP pyrophosphatase MutT (NUDIX family)